MRSIVLALAAAGVIWCAAPAVANELNPAAAVQSEATDFSSARRHRHHHNCRTVVVKRWSHGRRIVKRTRVCR
jgi:hypothetical protein